ncbi:phosphoglycerate mutase-like protein [Jackrogersella minutella]|nr:phosphoglycerate mutase-like protein [Jackrogersella minutella]
MGAFTYSTVPGFFLHDEQPIGPSFRAITQEGLGLIDIAYETDAISDPGRTKTQWERFVHFVNHQNARGRGRVSYKVIFLMRHGEGYHNVKEAQVGRHEWNSYWSLLEHDGHSNWLDARLTGRGREQARELNAFWRKHIENLRVPAPQSYYASPLARCLETTRLTYSTLNVPSDRPFRPVIKEELRERFGRHTCDRRSTKTWIASNYPGFRIDPSLTENDELWDADRRETEGEAVDRARRFLDDVFNNDDKTFISVTAHSGLIRALYSAIGHREVWVAAGALVPVLIRAELID